MLDLRFKLGRFIGEASLLILVGGLLTGDSRGQTRGITVEPDQPPTTNIPIPRNYALIFATDTYTQWPTLTNPISDADAFKVTLTNLYGFHVEVVPNPKTKGEILLKLNEYLHRKFDQQDQLLIFFAGHGYFDDLLGLGFLVPSEAKLIEDDPTHLTLLGYQEILPYVNHIPAQHILLMVDACFAGTLDRRIVASNMRGSDPYVRSTLPELLARKELIRTRLYITSGGKTFVPDGVPGHHSPFVKALLSTFVHAADTKGYLTLNDIREGLYDVKPEPHTGDIQDENDAEADFLLLTPSAIAQLSQKQQDSGIQDSGAAPLVPLSSADPLSNLTPGEKAELKDTMAFIASRLDGFSEWRSRTNISYSGVTVKACSLAYTRQEIIQSDTVRVNTMRRSLDLTKAMTNLDDPIPVPWAPSFYYFVFHFQEPQFRYWEIEEEGKLPERVDAPDIQTELIMDDKDSALKLQDAVNHAIRLCRAVNPPH